MSRLRLACWCAALLTTGCGLLPAASAPFDLAAAQNAREALVANNNRLIDSINHRLSERDLAASIASEHVALLEQRVGKLRARCEAMPRNECVALEPHLDWLAQVHDTTTLSIGVLRNDSRDFEEDKAEVLLWTKVFTKEIDSLERRVDRIAPTKVLLSQRSLK